MMRARAILSLACGLCAAACAGEGELPSFEITSLAFGDGETIPRRHTCDGAEISPPLRFEGAPEETESYAVVMYRADEGEDAFALWLLWGVSADASGIGEDVPRGEAPLPGVAQGTNDLDVVGYSGPCGEEVEEGEEPDTAEHRYVFRAFALSAPPSVDAGATAAQLLTAVGGVAVAEGTLEGTYAMEN